MIVTRVHKKTRLTLREGLEYQLLTYCFVKDLNISLADRKALVELIVYGPTPLKDFCTHITDLGIFKSSQSTRNALSKLEKMGLIYKIGKSRKEIVIHPHCEIINKPAVLLQFEFLAHGTNRS
jgi:hypothetical protein